MIFDHPRDRKGAERKKSVSKARFEIRKSRRGMTFVRAGREIETVDAFPRRASDKASGLGDWPLLQAYAYHWGGTAAFHSERTGSPRCQRNIKDSLLGILVNLWLFCVPLACGEIARDHDTRNVTLGVAEEVIRLGRGGAGDPAFENIGDAITDGGGRLYVVDEGAGHVRRYDSTGNLELTIGRHGQGPGEFQSLGPIGVSGDVLWVTDLTAQRMSLFDTGGTLVHDISLARRRITVDGWKQLTVMPTRLLTPDRFELRMVGGTAPESLAYRIPRLIVDSTGRIVDTNGVEIIEPYGARLRVRTAPRQVISVPVHDDTPVHVLGRDSRVEISWVPPSDQSAAAFTVSRISVKDTIYSKSYRYSAERYEIADRQRLAARFSQRLDVDAGRLVAEAVMTAKLPAFKVPVSAAFHDDEGRTWLKTVGSSGEDTRWLLLEADGTPRQFFQLPMNARILHAAGNRLWVTYSDSTGAPVLSCRRLR